MSAAAAPSGGFVSRVRYAAGNLAPEQRRAGLAAIVLCLTLLLPWYHKDITVIVGGHAVPAGHNVSGFGAFSFVEASLMLVSVAVLVLLFYRGEGRAFHLPGGDGFVIMLAGGWQALLIFYRMLDTPSLHNSKGQFVTDVGVQWGIFIAMLAALALAYSGARIRAAHRPEPRLAEDPTVRHDVAAAQPDPAATRPLRREERRARRKPVTRDDAAQLSFEVPEEAERDPFGRP
jgi:hypothetical protein